jgi:hypothetical protein
MRKEYGLDDEDLREQSDKKTKNQDVIDNKKTATISKQDKSKARDKPYVKAPIDDEKDDSEGLGDDF